MERAAKRKDKVKILVDGVENGLGSNAKRKFASKKPSKGKELTPSDSNLESEFKMKSKF